MSSLGMHGDPGGWQRAGHVIGAVVSQLADELAAADAHGGSGLRGAWSGPVADAYLELWHRRYNRYGDLLYHARRAAGAIIDFGDQLAGFQRRAGDLEAYGFRAGLHLAADELHFILPLGHENLPQHRQVTLGGLLAESEREIGAMWTEVRLAVNDVVTVLESAISALEDFEMLAISVACGEVVWAVKETFKGLLDEPLAKGGDLLRTEAKAFAVRAAHNHEVAEVLSGEWTKSADQGIARAGRSILSDANDAVDVADKFEGFAKFGGYALLAAQAVVTVGETYCEARKQGWVNAIEDHANGLSSLVAGVGVSAGIEFLLGTAAMAGLVAAAPVAVTIGAVVVGGLVCVGVGDFVQNKVNHHRAGTTRMLNDIGHGIGQASIWAGTETGLIPGSAS